MANVVKAPLVIVKDERGADQYLYQGATVPSYVKGEDLKRLKDEDLVETAKSSSDAESSGDSGSSSSSSSGTSSGSKS